MYKVAILRIYLRDNAGLNSGELLVAPLMDQGVADDVRDDSQLARPTTNKPYQSFHTT